MGAQQNSEAQELASAHAIMEDRRQASFHAAECAALSAARCGGEVTYSAFQMTLRAHYCTDAAATLSKFEIALRAHYGADAAATTSEFQIAPRAHFCADADLEGSGKGSGKTGDARRSSEEAVAGIERLENGGESKFEGMEGVVEAADGAHAEHQIGMQRICDSCHSGASIPCEGILVRVSLSCRGF